MDDDTVASRAGLKTRPPRQSPSQFSSISRDKTETENRFKAFQIRPSAVENSDALAALHDSGPPINNKKTLFDTEMLSELIGEELASRPVSLTGFPKDDWRRGISESGRKGALLQLVKRAAAAHPSKNAISIMKAMAVSERFHFRTSHTLRKYIEAIDREMDMIGGDDDRFKHLPSSRSTSPADDDELEKEDPSKSRSSDHLSLPGSSSSDRISLSRQQPMHYTISKDKTKDGGEPNLGRLFMECGRRL